MLLYKKEKRKENSDQLMRIMTQMIAGILACTFCLVSMTWAWFTASVNIPTQTIQSANRSTSVIVSEVGENNIKTPVQPRTSQTISLDDEQTTGENEGVVVEGAAVSWDLLPERSYEILMTGSGTAIKGYCEVALTHTMSGETTPITTTYKTVAFENNHTVKFTYRTGGFESVEGVTNTQWTEYVENTTPPTLTITSYWGQPAPAEQASQTKLMKLKSAPKEKVMLLSDGDVLGLEPIPCPEAKAETEVELEGFEIQEAEVVSAEEDYKVSLTLKEGYEMPGEVVVNIDGKDYVVSTSGAEASDDAPYYDAEAGILTVPAGLLSDGVKVSVKAVATQIPTPEPEEEATEEPTEEIAEETTDNNETQEDNTTDTSSENNVVTDNPPKKEEDSEQDSHEPVKKPTGDGGDDNNDDNSDETDNNSDGSSTGDSSSSDNNAEETEDEKADVKLNLSQLTINLEETKIPTNADLVLTLSAKEDKKLPEQILIVLDKTIYDENIDNEEIKEDKTEYVINTDGKNNPEGFEFDTESGELKILSKMLKDVREITITDTDRSEVDEDDEKAEITFEVKNLTFDFTDDEIVTDEDVVITFAAGEGYELPETIVITIDGEEYVIYTNPEDIENPDGFTFDIETGTLTISKDLLEDVKAITITAEGVEKEDEEEIPDADEKDESEDKVTGDGENGPEDGENTEDEIESDTDVPSVDDDTENDTDAPSVDDDTENEGETGDEDGENDETTIPETDTDNTPDVEGDGETETPETDTEDTTPTTPDTEDNTNAEQGSENVETEGNGAGSAENETEDTTQPTLDTESGESEENAVPTEPTPSTDPNEPVVTPETPNTEAPNTNESATGENSVVTNDEDSNSTENNDNIGNDGTEGDISGENTTSSSQNITPTVPTTTTPLASETGTPSTDTLPSDNI